MNYHYMSRCDLILRGNLLCKELYSFHCRSYKVKSCVKYLVQSSGVDYPFDPKPAFDPKPTT